ncbi:MAG: lipoprotein [Gammaproteobacteria bacterium]|nr:lipoprotein [Gammaproteobacteria bacterium]
MRIPLLIGLLALTAACGQKGDLYLPEDEPNAAGAATEQTCRSRTCKPVEAAPASDATAVEPAATTPAPAAAPANNEAATITLEPQPQEPYQQAPSHETTQ